MDFEKVLDDLQAASAAVPDIDGLRNIRTVLIQPDFFRQLEEIVARSHNQPDARHDLQSRLLAAKHAFREQKVSRAHDHAQSGPIVTGGGRESTSATPGSVSDLNVGGLRWTRLPANGAIGHGHHRPNRTEAAA